MNHRELLQHRYWIFDMDGTLTLAVHDFEAIRRKLGLPAGKPILESLAELPEAKALPLHRKLDEIELELAYQAQAAPGAKDLLDYLKAQYCRLGILTRNNADNIHITLKAAGLAHYFEDKDLISRDCAPPKPDPDGLHRLLKHWQGKTTKAVMVGDHLFDLHTGQAAGVTTVYVDSSGKFPYREQADVCIQALHELLDSEHD